MKSCTLRLVIHSLLLMAIFFPSSSELHAQSCSPQTNQVALFEDADYGGSCRVLDIGDYPNSGAMGIANDSVSSIMVGSNVIAKLCQDNDYQGRCETFTDHDSNLTNNYVGNDAISSARVYTPAAAPKIITFEEYSVGTEIRGQYVEKYGVSFGVPLVSPAKVIVPSEGTASGTQALEAPIVEMSDNSIGFEFISGQPWVKMAVGLTYSAPGDVDFTLYGYDRDNNLVSKTDIRLGPAPTPINNTIEIQSEQANIYRAELSAIHPAPGNEKFAIDNLEFEKSLPPPPDPISPTVRILSPVTGDQFATNSFQLDGTVEENVGLSELRMTISQPGKTPVSFYLSNYSGAPPNFTFGHGIWIGPLFEGENTVTVTATDFNNNKGEASVTVTYELPPPPPPSTVDLYPEAMEITQGIQDRIQRWSTPPFYENNTINYVEGVPLIVGKRTVVRLYGGTEGTKQPVTNVVAQLTGLRMSDGQILPGSPLYATPISITLDPKDTFYNQRADLHKSWNFTLPEQWTTQGPISLKAVVDPNSSIRQCSGCDVLSETMNVVNVTFQSVKDLYLHPFWVCVRRSASDPKDQCDSPSLTAAFGLIQNPNSIPELYPLALSNIQIVTPTNSIIKINGDFSQEGKVAGGRWNDALNKVFNRKIHDYDIAVPFKGEAQRLHIYYGIVPRQPLTGTTGIALNGWSVAVGIEGDALTAAHEVGHNLYLRHVSGCDNPSDVDENYPTYLKPINAPGPGPYYPPGSIGEWGLDTRLLNLKYPSSYLEPDLKDPNKYRDLMTYCNRSVQWISPYHYRKLLNSLRAVSTSSSESELEAQVLLQQQADQDYLWVTGELQDSDLITQFGPFYHFTLPSGTSDEAGQGAYRLELQDSQGEVLFTRNFDPQPFYDAADPFPLFFDEIVPFPNGTARVLLWHDQAVLATKIVSQHIPTVTVISPNGGEQWGRSITETISWEADDADGDDLFYTIQYSKDSGQTWETVDTNLTETKFDIPTDLLAGSDTSLIRVLVSDGVNTSSDQSDGTFFITDKPPVVGLISPLNGTSSEERQFVILEGVATDLEDGPLTGNSLTWSSDRAGFLGTGTRVDAGGLSPGYHQITLAVKDSVGQVVSETVQIEIMPTKLEIGLGEPVVTPVCDEEVSHMIQFDWHVAQGSNDAAIVESLMVSLFNGQTITFNGPFPNNGEMAIQVDSARGGPAEILLNAVDDTGQKYSASQSATLNQCPNNKGRVIYLPLIVKNSVMAPDLIVESLTATNNEVTIAIKNIGTAPVIDAYWVDVYFNPSHVPGLNQPWDTIAKAGVVWGVSAGANPPTNLPILPGETRTLTLDNAYFGSKGSSRPPYPVGVNVYAQVDSVDFSTNHGAVLESNEANNLFGPVTSVAGAEGTSQSSGASLSSPSDELPPRNQ